MAPKKNDDSIPKETRKRGDRGRTIMKSVIQERSRRNALLEVEWNRKGQPINHNASRFTSYIGLVTRREASILVPDWKDPYHDEAKEEIWQDILNTWNVNECHKSFVLSKAGTALNRHIHNLSIHLQNGRVEQPPKKYVDIISKEDWLEFVKHCNDPAFLLYETQSEELSLPRHRLFRTARLDKNGRTNNPKALQIIRDIGINPCVLLDKHGCAVAKGYMYNLEGDMLHDSFDWAVAGDILHFCVLGVEQSEFSASGDMGDTFLTICALFFLLIREVNQHSRRSLHLPVPRQTNALQETTCFKEHIQTSHFRKKLEEKVATALSKPLSLASPSSGLERNTRVFYPTAYGADPTGARDSSDAILKAIGDAFKIGSGFELLPGIKDLGGVVIDLQGGSYKISKPITFPSCGGNVVVKGGTLRAIDPFPGDRHLVELATTNQHGCNNKGINYEDITFQDILFDSSYRGGGISIIDSARIRINNCFFLHFTTQGILVKRGHETFISNSFLGQHSTVGGDIGERQFGGTAIDLSSNDNTITDVAIFSAAIGVSLKGQANMITGVHCYNKATGFGGIGIWVQLPGLSQTRIDNCYMDYNGIVLEDPVQVHITNGFFLGDGNIILKSIKGRISGLTIVDNTFSGNPNAKVPIVAINGKFSNIDQVVIDRNNVNGMSLKSTVGKLSVAGNGSKWVADFSKTLVFPNRINHFQYSIFSQGQPKFFAHSVTSVSNNIVVVESEKPTKGVVSFFVEQ
ncbi:hypothetical protein RIF29_04149 [Crotalaria pallida]|uniref:Right handed beta helix domain-containing protein n=1 Tax=Crotalaria pallida TaxID=3830 RepID=A0AAN9P9P6_CROPI